MTQGIKAVEDWWKIPKKVKDVGAKTGFYTEFLEIIDDLNSLDGLVLCKAKNFSHFVEKSRQNF